jgi:hypothetical protein
MVLAAICRQGDYLAALLRLRSVASPITYVVGQTAVPALRGVSVHRSDFGARQQPRFKLSSRAPIEIYLAAISVRPVEDITEGQAEHGVEPEQGLRQDRGWHNRRIEG